MREFEALEDVVPEKIRERNEISTELINYCLDELKPFKLNGKEKLNPHGRRVAEILVANEDGDSSITAENLKFTKKMSLSQFIKTWRSNFIKEMKPQNLPKGWSVDHLTIRTFGKKSKFYDENELK